jgi:small subunit ribosomal protein S13
MRIQGITIPDNKRLVIALTEIYGIGKIRAAEILGEVGISEDEHATNLSEDQEKQIRDLVEGFTIEGDLRRQKQANIQRLKEIGSYRGKRHAGNYPVRGQRTKTNQRTSKGNKRSTMGSGKRKLEKK